ncbi:phosphonate monoester hydrolase [Phaeobacter gallaeciensis]|uniref:Phosphonate monoester hydrolase n=1 Tax=Phaeobacter gallaeciensis TaxID=60890 RepID=A0A366X186_9RHOB|nr:MULTISPECIES: sulfatase-like hydrolase/transferase [Roseobacteraceae]MBT8166765.1 sulfatase-like hydrolase/transferase [Falsiruegeria litorea]RBW56212.1 phosphonate monoester hydrolase [Phaeobacter gallaeciensis]
MREPKNVLFVIIDQLRADCVFGALSDHVDLPNLRAFMDEAVTFKRHYSAVNPCGPSRASLLTGQYSMNHRSVRNGTPLRHDTPSVASEMRKAGYVPMLFGYTDTSQDPRAFHTNDPAMHTYEYPMAGFHEMLEMRFEMSYPWRSHLMNNGYSFDSYEQVYQPVSPTGAAPRVNDPALYRAEDSDTAFLTDRFLATMPAYADQSWFAHLTYIRPHPPMVAPAPYNNMYDLDQIPLPARLADTNAELAIHPFCGPAQASATPARFVVGFPDLEPTDENVQTLRTLYFGLATEVDLHIGRVIQFLKDSGQYDDTLVVITADHGEMLGDRHSWGKFSVYDAAYHTPLVIRAPGLSAGTEVTVPTESIDITPTILDWVGQEIPNSMDGRSLMPFLRGETPQDWRGYSFSELDFSDPETPSLWEQALGTGPSDSSLGILRDDRFTLVEFAADLPPILFDHEDAGEFANVADQPAYQADLNRLTRQMLRHRMRNMDHTLSLDSITNDGPRKQKRYP